MGARTSYEALLKTAVDAGNQGKVAEQHDALCEVLLQQEQYVAALRHADESLTRFKSLKSPYHVANGALQRADILWRLGRLDEADRELEGMFGSTSGMGKPTVALERSRAVRRARVLLARNENQRAAGVARRAFAALPADVPDVVRAGLQRALVLALARSGRAAEALSHLDEQRPQALNRLIHYQFRERRS